MQVAHTAAMGRRHHFMHAAFQPITALPFLILLLSATLPPSTCDATPHPSADHQLDVFLTGVAVHEQTPVDSPGRLVDTHGLAYVRCHPLDSVTSSHAHLDPAAVPHAFAAKADRSVGLHATAHIDAVGLPSETAFTHAQLAGMNVYPLGDWVDVHGSDLWCELYDIDRLRAGLLAPLGGGLLTMAAFVEPSSTHTRSVDGVAHVLHHTVAVNLSRTLAESTDAVHVATLHFVCPLCGFGQQGTPAGVAAVWTATAFGAAGVQDVGSSDALDSAGRVPSSPGAVIDIEVTESVDPVMAAIRDAIAAFDAHPVGNAADHASAVRDVLHWAIRASANHYHQQAADAAGDAGEAQARLAEAQAERISGPSSGAEHHGAGPITAAMLRDLEHEAHVVVSHGFKAAIKAGDPAIATTAILNLAAGLAARFDVPYRVVRVDAPLPPHVEAALVAHEARRKADGEQHGAVAIVAVTLLSSVIAFLAGYHGMNAYRAWAASRSGSGVLAVRKKLKRKNSDVLGGGNVPPSDAKGGGSMPTMHEQDSGTPGNTPRRVEQGGVLSPR